MCEVYLCVSSTLKSVAILCIFSIIKLYFVLVRHCHIVQHALIVFVFTLILVYLGQSLLLFLFTLRFQQSGCAATSVIFIWPCFIIFHIHGILLRFFLVFILKNYFFHALLIILTSFTMGCLSWMVMSLCRTLLACRACLRHISLRLNSLKMLRHTDTHIYICVVRFLMMIACTLLQLPAMCAA